MIPNKVTAVYFSPTGGTKAAVQYLLQCFDGYECKMLDNTLPVQRSKNYEFTDADLLIVACPVYAGQMPQVQGLFKNLRGNGTPCVLAACYGNRHYDDTLAQVQYILEQQGFKVIGGAAVVIPHVFAASLGKGRPDERDKAVLKTFADDMKAKLQQDAPASVSFPGNPQPQLKAPIPVPKTFDAERCDMCGACLNLCPAGALSADDMEGDSSICISCMRCVKYCHAGARSFSNDKISSWLEANFAVPRDVEVFK